jgi:hypothetical protein
MGKSNYDKKPATLIEGEIWKGWPPVLKQIRKTVLSRGNVKRCILAVECYHGVAHAELMTHLFRVVPFFDPAPWGGQWMKETFDLDKEVPNYGWCFDCVPEEKSFRLPCAISLNVPTKYRH